MSERWGRERVLGLAPDPPAAKAAGTAARPAKWQGLGCDGEMVWGECQGSGKSLYRACVDLAGPAFRCSCPSRKFPCKHALALLLLWSDGTVETGPRPGWAVEWQEQRRDRADQAQARKAAAAGRTPDPKTVERRERRVDDGLADLHQWLRDQVAHGLAQSERAPYRLWDDAARRLVDAQAPALAGQVKGMASLRQGEGWPDRMLEEYALLNLLVRAHTRRDELPEGLRATVRSRIGFTVTQEEVLRGEWVRDHWYVAGSADTELEQLTTRRVWLRGRETGRSALILSFGVPGRAPDASLLPATTADADLAFYPGAQPLRALVAARHPDPEQAPPRGTTIEGFLREYSAAIARDPWLERWPVVLEDVRLSRDTRAIDSDGDALPLDLADPNDAWRLLALSGGRPFTLTGEWGRHGLRPQTAHHPSEGVVVL